MGLTTNRFGTADRARHVMAAVRAGIEECEGTTKQTDGVTVKTSEVELPSSLAADRFGFRLRGGYEPGLYVLARRGKVISFSTVDPDVPHDRKVAIRATDWIMP